MKTGRSGTIRFWDALKGCDVNGAAEGEEDNNAAAAAAAVAVVDPDDGRNESKGSRDRSLFLLDPLVMGTLP